MTPSERKEYQHQHYLANKPKYNAQARAWRLKNLDRAKEYKRVWEKENRHVSGWPQEIKANYGVTVDQYNELFNLQLGCCAICGKHQSAEWRRLTVDHCHATKKIRGLLCSVCNRALGLFRDNPELLGKAIKYLNG